MNSLIYAVSFVTFIVSSVIVYYKIRTMQDDEGNNSITSFYSDFFIVLLGFGASLILTLTDVTDTTALSLLVINGFLLTLCFVFLIIDIFKHLSRRMEEANKLNSPRTPQMR